MDGWRRAMPKGNIMDETNTLKKHLIIKRVLRIFLFFCQINESASLFSSVVAHTPLSRNSCSRSEDRDPCMTNEIAAPRPMTNHITAPRPMSQKTSQPRDP